MSIEIDCSDLSLLSTNAHLIGKDGLQAKILERVELMNNFLKKSSESIKTKHLSTFIDDDGKKYKISLNK